MKDGRNREIDYLRISITDRCNLRCIYCMPEDGVPCMKHKEILTYEEIGRLCRIFVKLGIHKFKITGGEPLVRKNTSALVEKINQIPGVESITMTTNGILLSENIDALVAAGLSGINISMDSMKQESSFVITRRNDWKGTMEGIEAALKYPSLRVKINCVPVLGINDTEWLSIAKLASNHPIHVRFIEMMPIGLGKEFQFVGEEQVIQQLEESLGTFTPCEERLGNGPAHYFHVAGFQGKIGFISARSHKFCDSCNRVRLTADGFLKTCLQYHSGCDLKALLRNSTTDEEIENVIVEALYHKPESHHFEDNSQGDDLEHRKMSSIGG